LFSYGFIRYKEITNKVCVLINTLYNLRPTDTIVNESNLRLIISLLRESARNLAVSYDFKIDDNVMIMRERKLDRIRQISQGTHKIGDRLSDLISKRSGISRSSRNTDSTKKNNPMAIDFKGIKGFRAESYLRNYWNKFTIDE